MASNRNAVVIGIVIAGVAIGYLAYKGMGGHPQQAEGTIGAAKREVSQQIAPGDVKLTDAQIQEFLQSDTFHKLQTDPAYRRAVEGGLNKFAADGGLQAVANDVQAREALTSDGMRMIAKDGVMNKLFDSPEALRAMTTDAGMRELVRKDLFRQAVETVANSKFAPQIRDAAMKGKLDVSLLGSALDAAKFETLLKDPSWVAMVSSPDVARIMFEPPLRRAIADPTSLGLLSDPGLGRLLDSEQGRRVFEKPLMNLLASGDLGLLVANDTYRDALCSDLYKEASASPDFGKRAFEAPQTK